MVLPDATITPARPEYLGKAIGWVLPALALVGMLQCGPAAAQGGATSDTAQTVSQDDVSFVPPKDGPPDNRAGAGTRGLKSITSLLAIVVPARGGLTTLAIPPLVWQISESVDAKVSVGLADVDPSGSSVGGSFQGRFGVGLYAVDLRRSDMELQVGHIYRFTVSVTDAKTGDLLGEAATLVERVAPEDPSASDDATVYGDDGIHARVKRAATAGLWFDALALVVEPDLSGRARIVRKQDFEALVRSAGIELR